MTPIMWMASVVFVLVFILIASEKINKTITAILGGCFFIISGAVEGESVLGLIDWNVIFVLIGLMLIISITKRTGVFQFVAIKAARLARGEPWRILVLLSLVTALFSMVLDTVTTVLILVPVALNLAQELELDPKPFIITMALASNLGGSATMIGDPPNIMIGSIAHLGFIDFIQVNMVGVLIILVFYSIFLALFFHKRMKVSPAKMARIMNLDARAAIGDWPLLIKSLLVLVLVIAFLTLHRQLDIPPATIALCGGFVLVLLADRHKIDQFLQEIEWGTIFFFIGLFIMVEGLVALGVIRIIADGFISLTAGNLHLTTLLMLWFAGILSAFIDNIPLVATLAPLIVLMGQTLGTDQVGPLWWALSLGACIGGNGTLIGSSSGVVSAGLSKKAGHPISFMEFTRYGAPITLATLAICTVYLFVRFFV